MSRLLTLAADETVTCPKCSHTFALESGISHKVLDLTDEDMDEMFSINVKAAVYGMQTIVPHFQERNAGQVVNISSFLGRVPVASIRSAYSAAKAALNSLTANLRMDLAITHPGIHVTLVMPGLVSTDFQRNALGGSPPIPAATESQPVEDAVAAIVQAIDHPVAEIYTNPQHAAPLVARYFQDVGAFERAAASRV